MNAPNSNSFFSSHNKRSSSVRSNAPSRLQSTRYCGGATVETVSICRKPSRRTVSRTPRALPSSACARTAIRRACARLIEVDFATFALSQLPEAPARVLEVGCGERGGITTRLADAGYAVAAVDPRAPEGPRYRRIRFQELVDESYDAVVAERVLHHVHPLDESLDKLAALAPLLVLDEFAWDRIDDTARDWYEAQ